ncbi:MAG: hypothetical protein ACJ0G7_03125 [Parasynechococcus sp.]|uniref:hypothetical protein n=1 Tax=Parasynechococcus sp. TaxID=3101203 RepID=UPI003887106F
MGPKPNREITFHGRHKEGRWVDISDANTLLLIPALEIRITSLRHTNFRISPGNTQKWNDGAGDDRPVIAQLEGEDWLDIDNVQNLVVIGVGINGIGSPLGIRSRIPLDRNADHAGDRVLGGFGQSFLARA